MNIRWMSPLVSAVGFVLLAGAAGQAVAQMPDPSAPKTRAEVQAELLEAQRTGNIVSWDERGMMLNEMHPQNYPPKPAGMGLSREQVMADLMEAQRTGNIMSWGESGLMLNELYPQRYPPKPATQGLTREQVQSDIPKSRSAGSFMWWGGWGK